MSKKKPEYFPDEIEYVPGKVGQRGYHIDPTTGKRTYPSWHKRAQTQFITLDELGRRTRPPTKDDHDLMRLIEIQLNMDGVDVSEGVPTKELIRIIKELGGEGTQAARESLYGLWDAGLVRLEGKIHDQSGRPFNQLWYFTK